MDCDAIGIEVGFHVRDVGKSYDYEGRDTLVVVLDRKDAFQMVLEKDDDARQDILNRSLVYLGGAEYGLSLLDRDPMVVDTQGRSKSGKIDASSTAGASTSASRLIHSNPNLLPSAAGNSSVINAPKVDLSQSKPAVAQADADKLQAQYQPQLDVLSKEGQAKFAFVDYDPPAFVVVSKQMVLQMTMKNTARFDPEKANVYKRAAQTFDLFVAPKMKDLLERIPAGWPVDYYDFSVVNLLTPGPAARNAPRRLSFSFQKTFRKSLPIRKSQIRSCWIKGKFWSTASASPSICNSRNSRHTLRAFWPGVDPRAIPAHSHCIGSSAPSPLEFSRPKSVRDD